MRIPFFYTLLIFIQLACAIIIPFITIAIDGLKIINDPARTQLSLYANDGNHPKLLDTIHMNKDGIFTVQLFDENVLSYDMVFHSLDIWFPFPSYTLNLVNDTVIISQVFSGLHGDLQNTLPSINGSIFDSFVLNSDIFHITLPPYLHETSSGIFAQIQSVASTIPGLGYIVNNKWALMAFISVITIAAAPAILTTMDPAFADRIVQAQLNKES
jgi:hypothetical protein